MHIKKIGAFFDHFAAVVVPYYFESTQKALLFSLLKGIFHLKN